MKGYKNKAKSKSFRERVNEEIRSKKVLCIDSNNNNIGVVETKDALALAYKENLDLVQISFSNEWNVPACKILDYGKYKYDLSKKKKILSKKQRESVIKLKEVKFRPCTDDNDLKIKAKRAKLFLDDGCRVKVTVKFKGRELALKKLGFKRLEDFLNLIEEFVILSAPTQDGRNLITIISKSDSTG